MLQRYCFVIVVMVMAGLLTGMMIRRTYASHPVPISPAALPGDSSPNTGQHQTVPETSTVLPPKATEKKSKSGSCATCPSASGKREPVSVGGMGKSGPSRKYDDPWLVVTGLRRSEPAPVIHAGHAHLGTVAATGRVLLIAGSSDDPVQRVIVTWQQNDAGFTFDMPIAESDRRWLETDVLPLVLAASGQDFATGMLWHDLEIDSIANGEITLCRPETVDGVLDSCRLFIDGAGTMVRMERVQGKCDPSGGRFTARRALVWCAGPLAGD